MRILITHQNFAGQFKHIAKAWAKEPGWQVASSQPPYLCQMESDVDFDPEFPSRFDTKAKLRTWNALHLQNLENCDAAVTPTKWHWQQHPLAYRDKITIAHEGIDTENLGPITNEVIVGGDDVSYGSKPKDAPNWREKMLSEVSLDPTRTHFMGKVPYETYKTVLQVSAAHIYLTYPFVLSWSMLEAMASGCLIVGSNTPPVQEMIHPGKTGHLVNFNTPEQIADQTVVAMQDMAKALDMKLSAQDRVHANLSLASGLCSYSRLLDGFSPSSSAVNHNLSRPSQILAPRALYQSNKVDSEHAT